MPKYDVFPNPSGDGYILGVQTDLLSDCNTTLVVPLLPTSSAPKPVKGSTRFDFEDQPVVMATQFMAGVPTAFFRSQLENLMKILRRSDPRSTCLFRAFRRFNSIRLQSFYLT